MSGHHIVMSKLFHMSEPAADKHLLLMAVQDT